MNWRDIAVGAGLLALVIVLHETGRRRDRRRPPYGPDVSPDLDSIIKRSRNGEGRQ